MRIDSELVSVRHLRRERWVERLGLLALWLAGGALIAGSDPGSSAACWTPLLLLGGTSVLLSFRAGLSLAGTRSLGEHGSLSIEGGVVEVEAGSRMHGFSCAELASGWIEPGWPEAHETAVLVTRGGLEVRVAIKGADAAAAVLHAAGLGPEQRAVRMRVGADEADSTRAYLVFLALLASVLALGCAGVVALLVPYFGHGGAFFLLALCGIVGVPSAVVAWYLLRRLATTALTIGTDGVVVERFWRRRLLRRAEIEDVLVIPGTVVFQLANGERVRVPASPPATMAASERIREALRGTPSAPIESLDRGGRPIAAWLGALRALGKDAQGYREASLDRRDLAGVLKDGAAPAERRIAAAAALSARDDEESRTALRVAVDTCVDDRLRVALDHAAEGTLDEEELEQAVTHTARRA